MVIKSINYKVLSESGFIVTSINKDNITELLGVGNENYELIEVSKDTNGNPFIKIIGTNKWEGLTACGTYTDMEVGSDIECELPSSFVCGVDKLIDTRGSTPEEYATVKIGDQCWMAEDLRYQCSNFHDEGENDTNWSGQTDACAPGGYDSMLYQWGAAMAGSTTPGDQGLCPLGWHVPTDEEWKILEMELGIPELEVDITGWRGTDEGDQLKSISPNWCKGDTNCATSGFNALPAGNRITSGGIDNIGSYNLWWTSTSSGTDDAWRHNVYSDNSNIYRRLLDQANGYSVRCLLGP